MLLLTMMMLLAGADDTPLELTCRGGGSARHVESSSVYATNSEDQSGWATVDHYTSEAFEDQVDVRVAGDESRIRLPRTMLPRIHGGDQGWFKLKNASVGTDAISGSASVNPLNNPKVFIDRRTGSITIDEKAGHYSGQYERYNPAIRERKF